MTAAELLSELQAADGELVAALNRRLKAAQAAQAAGLKLQATEAATLKAALAATPPSERDTVYAVYERVFGGARGLVETIARGVCVRGGKLLLCRARGAKVAYLPGGHIEFGETGREALLREVREELGVAATAGRFLGVVENSFLQHGKPHAEINLVYALELDVGERPQSCEDYISFEWCPLGELAAAGLLPLEFRRLAAGGEVRFEA